MNENRSRVEGNDLETNQTREPAEVSQRPLDPAEEFDETRRWGQDELRLWRLSRLPRRPLPPLPDPNDVNLHASPNVLGLNYHVATALERRGINTLAQLEAALQAESLSGPGLGRRRLATIRRTVAFYYSLRGPRQLKD